MKIIKKMIDFVIRKIMDRDLLDRLIHDLVVSAYVTTFQATELQKLGLIIATNTSTNKSRFLGTSLNPIYPEIVVWKPENLFSTTGKGKAVLVACIETHKTLETNIYKWKFLASLGIIVNLVVEANDVARAKVLLKENNIDLLIKLQQYKFNMTTKKYDFFNVT